VTGIQESTAAEIDRQLNEVRHQADGLASRAATLLAASTIGATILVAAEHAPVASALLLVSAVISGAVIAPTLVVGPYARDLDTWLRFEEPGRAGATLHAAKLTMLDANRARLHTSTLATYAQLGAIVAALICAVAGR
jgi:hypothetical protein